MDRRSMVAQSLEGIVKVVATLGVCLFLPAWTWRFWQAWVFLGVFVACTLGITAYLFRYDPQLLQRRLKGGPGAEQLNTQKAIQVLAGLTFLASLVVPALDHRFSWSPLPLAASLAGDLLVVLAFAVIFRVFRENSFTASTIRVDTEQSVVSTGPYAIVRHPMYSGGLILFLGMPLALGSGVGFLCFVPAVATIVWRLLDEERFLNRNLPGYEAYRLETRYRLIPRVW